MTDIKGGPPADAGSSYRPLLVAFFPVIVLGAFTAVLAVVAALVGWRREEMLLTAAGIGCLLAIPTVVLIYRERVDREAARRALENVQARVAGIVESAMDAIITIDEAQRVVLFNAAAEEVFKCARQEAIGAPLAWFIPDRFRPSHAEHVRAFGEGVGTSRRMGHARVVMGLRRDGEEFPIEASISQATEGGQRFFTVILRDVTQRVRAEKALRDSREEFQALALEASGAREDEKRRIARELHDELGQALTSLKIDVSWLRDNLGAASPEVQRKLAAMQLMLDGTVAAARRISADLRPLMLDDLGLTAAADWLAQNFTNRTGVPCELVIGTGELDLPDPYATAVFRVLQESLTNIARHAQATQVEATLEREESEVVLTVRDNGKGFEPGGARKPGSFGLVGLRERAYLVGGDVAVRSSPGQGTTVELRIPTKSMEAPA